MAFGFLLATVDLFVLSALKLHHIGRIKSDLVFLLSFIVYGIQPLVFYRSLSYANMINMNFMWDVASDIMVAIVGFMIFKEVLTQNQMIGAMLGLVSLRLLK